MRGITSIATLGSTIRGERLRSGLTQAELAQRAGVSRATIIGVEAGGRFDVSTLFTLLKALDLEITLNARPALRPSILDESEEL